VVAFVISLRILFHSGVLAFVDLVVLIPTAGIETSRPLYYLIGLIPFTHNTVWTPSSKVLITRNE